MAISERVEKTMSINWNMFIAAVAIGALAEMITQEYSNVYRRSVSVGKVLIIAFAIALLPIASSKWAVLGLLIARVGDVVGKYIYKAVVKVALWWG